MRRLFLTLFGVLWVIGVSARGHIHGDFGFSLGGGKLEPAYATDLGFSLNINGHLNYIRGIFLADAGLGLLMINDRGEGYNGSKEVSNTEMFAEMPVGLGLIFDVGGAKIIVGGELGLLFSPGGGGTFSGVSPHVDILWDNKRNMNNNGMFFKAMYYFGDHAYAYEPRYFGVGYKILLGSKKKAATQKSLPVSGSSN